MRGRRYSRRVDGMFAEAAMRRKSKGCGDRICEVLRSRSQGGMTEGREYGSTLLGRERNYYRKRSLVASYFTLVVSINRE